MLTPRAAKQGGSLAGNESRSAVSTTSSGIAAMVTLAESVCLAEPAEAQQDDGSLLSQPDPPKKMGAALPFSQDIDGT